MAKVSAKRSARVPFRESAARVAPGSGRGTVGLLVGVGGAGSELMTPCQAEVPMHPAGWSTKRGLSAASRLSGEGRFAGYVMRGRWLSDDRYGQLRNAEWMLRNSRVGTVNNPAALRVVIQTAEGLVAAGDPLADILEAFAELLIHP